MALAGAGCPSRPAARLPTEKESGPVKTVVNYGPRQLRVFPTPQGYLILASEQPGLPAVFRPLGVTAQRPPAGSIGRAGTLAWVAGHAVEAAGSGEPQAARFVVYDVDAKVGTPVQVALPVPCQQPAGRLPLLQGDPDKIHALVRCDGSSILLTLDGEGRQLAARTVAHPGASAELYLHQPDADYLVAGRLVLRSDPQATATATATLPSGGSSDTRELLVTDSLLLVVDGGSGLLTALDRRTLERRFEERFATGGERSVLRLRAAMGSAEQLDIVTAESRRADADGEELFATSLRLGKQAAGQRLRLGGGLGLHELVALSPDEGGGVLLVYTHRGNTGPQVALRKLTL